MEGLTSLASNFCKILWKEVCPSVAVSVIKLVSTLDRGFTVVKWLTWWEVELVIVASGLRYLEGLLRFLAALVSVFVFWHWHLWLLEARGVACHFCNWGALLLLDFVLGVVGWTLLQ